MKNNYYTEAEQVNRIWDIEDIKDLMSRRVYYEIACLRRDELNDLWVAEPQNRKTASLGRNWGYYTGMDEISNYYIVQHDRRRREHLKAISAANPKINECSKNLGIGSMSHHPVSTPLVQLSGDGKTGKGLWYCISQETASLPDGTANALWITEKIGVDFIKESGKWKIWHMVTATDFTNEAGSDYANQPVYLPDGADPVKEEFGTPTIPMLVHDNMFNWWDNYPPEPRPYFTFNEEISYGPEGHPSYQGGAGNE